MINFLAGKKEEAARFSVRRKQIVAVTTGVLVVYVVGLAAFGGWWWWIVGRREQQVQEVERLRVRLTQQAQTEVLVRKLAQRSQVVLTFLTDRGEAAKQMERLVILGEGVAVERWSYSGGGEQSVEVVADSAAGVAEFAGRLAQNYEAVQISKAVFNPGGGWRAMLKMKGGGSGD